jgi:hypothetical protein
MEPYRCVGILVSPPFILLRGSSTRGAADPTPSTNEQERRPQSLRIFIFWESLAWGGPEYRNQVRRCLHINLRINERSRRSAPYRHAEVRLLKFSTPRQSDFGTFTLAAQRMRSPLAATALE